MPNASSGHNAGIIGPTRYRTGFGTTQQLPTQPRRPAVTSFFPACRIKIGSKRLGSNPEQKHRARTNDPAAKSRVRADTHFPTTGARLLLFGGLLALSTLHR